MGVSSVESGRPYPSRPVRALTGNQSTPAAVSLCRVTRAPAAVRRRLSSGRVPVQCLALIERIGSEAPAPIPGRPWASSTGGTPAGAPAVRAARDTQRGPAAGGQNAGRPRGPGVVAIATRPYVYVARGSGCSGLRAHASTRSRQPGRRSMARTAAGRVLSSTVNPSCLVSHHPLLRSFSAGAPQRARTVNLVVVLSSRSARPFWPSCVLPSDRSS